MKLRLLLLDWLVAIIVAVGVVVYSLWLNYLDPGYFRLDDNGHFFLPNYYYNVQTLLKSGELPVINWHQYAGNEHLGQGQTGVLFVPSYLAYGFSQLVFGHPWHTVEVLIVFHLVLAGIGLYVWARHLNLTRVLALLCAWVWVTLPFIAGTSRSWAVMSFLAGYLPWIFWQLDKLLASKAWQGWGLVWSFTLLVYTGYIPWLITVGLFLWLYVFVWAIIFRVSVKTLVVACSRLLIMCLIVVGLSAPQLWPVWTTVGNSLLRAQEVSHQAAVSHSVNLVDWLGAQVFVFRQDVFRNQDSHVYYLGLVWLIPIVLALAGGGKSRSSHRFVILAVIALVCTTTAFGLLYLLPFVGMIRWPYKNLMIVALFATVAFARVLEMWQRNKYFWALMVCLLALVCNLIIVTAFHGVDAAFFPRKVTVPVDTQPLASLLIKPGRVITYRSERDQPQHQTEYLTQNFATVFNQFHLAGYDPVVSATNQIISLGANGTASYEAIMTPPLLDYFSSWGVRYFVGNKDVVFPELAELGLQKIGTTSQVQVWENPGAFPMVYQLINNQRVLIEFRTRGNSMVVDDKAYIHNRPLVFLVAPLPEFRALINDKIAPQKFHYYGIEVRTPPLGGRVELKYRQPRLVWGGVVASITLILALALSSLS